VAQQARPVLGIGHPRGGTRYVSRLLVAAGVRALHEAKGRDGSVSCWLSAPDWYHPHANASGLRSEYPDARLLHIIRHPLAAIASLSVFHHPSWWHWQEKHSGVEYEPKSLDFYAQFWIRWNAMIDAQQPFARLRIEHPEETWPEIARALGLSEAMPPIEVDPTWITKKKPTLAWSDLGKREDEVRAMAQRLGYEE
jgi:hypothetical protein